MKKMVELAEPDKGRAWVVALAACMINLILSGLARLIGIMYVAIIDEYGVLRAEATLPFTVRSSVTCLSGPLVGVIGERFGARAATFYGGLLAAAGAVMCCIAPNIVWLTIFWGGVHGLGFGLATTFFQVVVNQHFQKHRATASGIAMSGAGIGSLCLPVLVDWILKMHGLSGLFLILGGIIMHALPPSLLLSSPQWIKHPEAYARLHTKLKDHTKDATECHANQKELTVKKLAETTLMNDLFVRDVAILKTSDSLGCEDITGKSQDCKLNAIKKKRGKNQSKIICTQYVVKESTVLDRQANFHNEPKDNHMTSDMYSISHRIPYHTEKTESAASKITERNQTVTQSLKKTFNLYLNPMYILISFSMVSYNLIYNPTCTVLVDYGKDKGIVESYGKYLINAMSIGDLTGRLCFGWVTDKKLVSLPSFMCLMFVLQGSFIVLFPLASSFSIFIVLLVFYSITAGSILTHIPILVHQYVCLDSQSVAMACVKFMSGVTSFGVPSMIGHFRDGVGSYDGMFYLIGIVSIVFGAVWVMEPFVLKSQCGMPEEDAKVETG